MNRNVLIIGMAGVAVMAVGCTTTLEPIGSVAGTGGAGFGGSAGVAGGFPPDASMGGEGGAAAVGGCAGAAGFGVAGAGGLPPDAGSCDDGDPCTIDYFLLEGGCYSEWNYACGMAGSGGEAGGGAGGGAIGGTGGFAGEAGVGGGEAGGGAIGGTAGFAGSAGFGGAGGCGEMGFDDDEMGFDDDADGYQNSVCGGDCDDSDANAYPWQQSFYSAPRNSGGFDYDCDGQVTLRWGELHEGCSLDPAMQACVGSGWTSPDMNTAFLPGCGQSAAFAFCEFTGTDCAISMHTVTQACR